MKDEEKASPQPEPQRLGQDEINLTEFPIALLSDRSPRGNPMSRRFTNGEKVWEIEGTAGHGLPTRLDMEVYVVLTELTREQDFPERVQFTRHDLLQRLGWGSDARRYARLQQALDCWVGVTIRTTNSFYDKKAREWLRRHAFHLLEEYQIHERRRGDGGDEADALPSWFRWSDTIRRNMQARYLKPLDVELFLTFRSAITQALYRYLDAKRLNGKPHFQQSLLDLGKQHLGLPASYYPSQIKRELDVAHEELIAVGFLAAAHYEPMRGSGGEKVVYQFAPKRAHSGTALQGVGRRVSGVGSDGSHPTPDTRHPTPDIDALAQQLVEHGVAGPIAAELVAERRAECEAQLAYLPYRERLQNPGGALRRAIEEAWPAPEGWKQAQARQRRQSQARQRRQEEQAREQQAEAEAAAFDAWWAALPEPERAALTAQAQAELLGDNAILAQHYARHPERLHEALRPLLRRRMS